jgi:hypothetical protein
MRDACQVTGKPEAGGRIQETGESLEPEIGDRMPDADGGEPEVK